MKKLTKYLSLLLVILSIAFVSAGCFDKTKEQTFSESGISITLTNEFTQKTLLSQIIYLESADCIFVASKEDFSSFEELDYSTETMTVNDYMELVEQANSISAQKEYDAENNLTYMVYVKLVSGKSFAYYAYVFKTQDAFWLCQFACLSSEKSEFKTKFHNWAKTIKFDA